MSLHAQNLCVFPQVLTKGCLVLCYITKKLTSTLGTTSNLFIHAPVDSPGKVSKFFVCVCVCVLAQPQNTRWNLLSLSVNIRSKQESHVTTHLLQMSIWEQRCQERFLFSLSRQAKDNAEGANRPYWCGHRTSC